MVSHIASTCCEWWLILASPLTSAKSDICSLSLVDRHGVALHSLKSALLCAACPPDLNLASAFFQLSGTNSAQSSEESLLRRRAMIYTSRMARASPRSNVSGSPPAPSTTFSMRETLTLSLTFQPKARSLSVGTPSRMAWGKPLHVFRVRMR